MDVRKGGGSSLEAPLLLFVVGVLDVVEVAGHPLDVEEVLGNSGDELANCGPEVAVGVVAAFRLRISVGAGVRLVNCLPYFARKFSKHGGLSW